MSHKSKPLILLKLGIKNTNLSAVELLEKHCLPLLSSVGDLANLAKFGRTFCDGGMFFALPNIVAFRQVASMTGKWKFLFNFILNMCLVACHIGQ